MSRWLGKQGPVQPPGAPVNSQSLFTNPVAQIGLDLLTQWWTQQPLLKSARHAEEAVHEAIAPLVRRHPVAVLGTAAAAGALLVWSRPWRWLPGLPKLGSIASSLALGAVARIALQRKGDSSHADL